MLSVILFRFTGRRNFPQSAFRRFIVAHSLYIFVYGDNGVGVGDVVGRLSLCPVRHGGAQAIHRPNERERESQSGRVRIGASC